MSPRARKQRGAVHAMANSGMRLFYSYAHEDEDLRDQLEKHLATLRAKGIVSEWHDRRIGAGTPWREEIEHNLDTAHIILLLVSPDFLASPYCYEVEAQRALQRHRAGTARVIPVLLRPTDWEGAPFAKLQVVPSKAKPVVSWSNRDAAFADIASHIRAVCEELRQIPGDPSNPYAIAKVGDWAEYEHAFHLKANDQEFLAHARHEVVEKNAERAVIRITGDSRFGADELRLEVPVDRPFEDTYATLVREAIEKVPSNARVERRPTGAGIDKLFIGERVYYATWASFEITVILGLQKARSKGKVWVDSDVPLDGVVKLEQDNPDMTTTMILVDCGRSRGKRR